MAEWQAVNQQVAKKLVSQAAIGGLRRMVFAGASRWKAVFSVLRA